MPDDASPSQATRPTAPTSALDSHEQALLACLQHNGARCPACGYNLRGVGRLECPECGEAITWASLTRPRRRGRRSWLTCVIVLATLLPESMVQWQYVIHKRQPFYDVAVDWEWRPPYYFDEWMKALPSLVLWLGSPIMLAMLLLLHRRWTLLPRWLRGTVATLAVLAALWAYRRWQFWYGWWPWADDWWYYSRLGFMQ